MEYEELQWVWKQWWWHSEFVPEPGGRRPLGRQFGRHCSVREKNGHRNTVRTTVRGGQATGWTGDYMALARDRNAAFPMEGQRVETWHKVILKYSCLISKVHNPTPPPCTVKFQRKANALQAPLSTRVVFRGDHSVCETEKMSLDWTQNVDTKPHIQEEEISLEKIFKKLHMIFGAYFGSVHFCLIVVSVM